MEWNRLIYEYLDKNCLENTQYNYNTERPVWFNLLIPNQPYMGLGQNNESDLDR